MAIMHIVLDYPLIISWIIVTPHYFGLFAVFYKAVYLL